MGLADVLHLLYALAARVIEDVAVCALLWVAFLRIGLWVFDGVPLFRLSRSKRDIA